jgi:hypothetical protein
MRTLTILGMWKGSYSSRAGTRTLGKEKEVLQVPAEAENHSFLTEQPAVTQFPLAVFGSLQFDIRDIFSCLDFSQDILLLL